MQQRGKTARVWSIPFALAIALAGGLVTWAAFRQQVNTEHRMALDDLDRRANVLTVGLAREAAEALGPGPAPAGLAQRLKGHGRLLGFALVDEQGRTIASGEGVAEFEPVYSSAATGTANDRTARSMVDESTGLDLHVFVRPLPDTASPGGPRGALVALHDAAYLGEREMRGTLRGLMWALGAALGLFLLAGGGAYALFERPLFKLADWMRRLRIGNTPESPPTGLPVRRLADESRHLAASFRAIRLKEQAEAAGIVRSEKAWTRDRLRAHALEALDGRALVIVSNREPYVHTVVDGKPKASVPAGGLVTALDPVLRATGGLWVAHGSGDGDRITADAGSCVTVPPDDPRYTLRRVWLTREQEQGHYYGFSNEGLWPLCHLTHERPIFRAGDWDQYVEVNRKFADAVMEEIGDHDAVVLVQDYQLALVPRMLKDARPNWRVGLFWHIPWPNPESFRICPYRDQILRGMLGADVIGFHLQQFCNNFLDTVDRMMEARLDWDHFTVELRGHLTYVRPLPISVEGWSDKGVPRGRALAERVAAARVQHRLENVRVAMGVDRIDYTKGIAERLRAIDRFFENSPEQRGKITFVQLGAPSRTHIPRYRELVSELEALTDQINWKYQTEHWKPIRLLVSQHDALTVYTFMKMAEVCIVSSLHDGMNLVAKEYVSAQTEGDQEAIERLISPQPPVVGRAAVNGAPAAESSSPMPGVRVNGEVDPGAPGAAFPGEPAPGEGVLILSEFAGAARDLPEALIINPYDTEQFAAAIKRAFEMPPAERRQRMTRLRVRVEENNVYRWAAELIATVAQAKPDDPANSPTSAGEPAGAAVPAARG